MATSPIYGWAEPDNTDLVKNGALAIRTLGNAIDTTMGTMTPKSTYTAKGSIAAATAASTPANLAVGSNGETLVADSSTSTGLRYTAGTVQANPVINSAMQIFQRSTTPTTGITTVGAIGYTLDRWQSRTASGGGSMVTSQQVTNDTTNLPFIQYCARVRRATSNTDTGALQFIQAFESINSIPFSGKTVTVSFYARKSATFTGTFNAYLYSGTGTDQSLPQAYTGVATVASTLSVALTTTWARYTFTGTVGSTATELGISSEQVPSGTAGAADYYEITGVQIDIGSVALPFRTYAATIEGELAACQRYLPAVPAGSTYSGYAYATNGTIYTVPFAVSSRIAPTGFTTSGTIKAYALNVDTTLTPTFNDASTTGAALLASLTITAGQGSRLNIGAGASILFTGCEL